MKIFTTRVKSLLPFRKLLLASAIILNTAIIASAQEYVTSQTNAADPESVVVAIVTITAPASVSNASNVIGTPDGNAATLSASGIKATDAITLASNASISLTMPSNIPAGKHAFVRIDEPEIDGISLDLSNLVNLLGLLTNNTIRVTTNAGTASSTFVRDASGNLYIQVTSNSAFNVINVTLDFAGLGGLAGIALATIELDVYHAVTYENASYTACNTAPLFTALDPSAGLLTANLLTLTSPENAIDGNVLTSSTFTKTAGVASTVGQSFYLGKTASSTAQITATISRPTGLADVTALSGFSIRAYNGNDEVYSTSLYSALLNVQLINFTNFQPANLVVSPNSAFDRIVISQSGTVSALITINLHEVAARPAVTFDGGVLTSIIADSGPVTRSLNSAVASSSASLPGFSIACGTFTEFTYELFNVTQNGRVLAGTLPASLTLSAQGVLSGSPSSSDVGTFTFDVLATNAFGQSDVATFSIIVEPPLPVTLVSFKAASEGNTAVLSWSTSLETNSDRFDIERSQNGKSWYKIGSVKSNQESNSLKFYSFVDAKPLNGQNLYRLKMIDLDETFAYSSVQNVSLENTAFLYPNPVREGENLNLNLTDWSAIKSVKVVNAAGKLVFESSNALSAGISTSNLSTGIYVLQVVQKDGNVLTQKFIRQ